MSKIEVKDIDAPSGESVLTLGGTNSNTVNVGKSTSTTNVKGGTINLGASGTNLVIPSGATITNNGTGVGFGKVVQIVSAEYYSPGSTGSGSFVNTGLSATITPTSASNKILIMVSGTGLSGSGCAIAFRVYRGATAIGITAGPSINGAGAAKASYSIVDIDDPATTSATTYHLKFRSVSGASNAENNPGSEGSFMTLMEVVA